MKPLRSIKHDYINQVKALIFLLKVGDGAKTGTMCSCHIWHDYEERSDNNATIHCIAGY